MRTKTGTAGLTILTTLVAGAARAEWKPTKTVDVVVTGGPGGGTDQFARTIQAAITKNKLMDANLVVMNKGGGSGAEGFVSGKVAAGDPHTLVFGTSNEWVLPLVAKLAFGPSDLKPGATMARVSKDATASYVDLLRRVRPTREWQDDVARTAQTDRFLDVAQLGAFRSAAPDPSSMTKAGS